MVDVAVSAGRVLLALVLVALNGFFVASEFAYVRIRATSVEQLVEEGRPGSGALEAALENLDDYLAVTQLGITISSLGLGWIGEPAVAALVEPVLGPLLPEGLLHLVAFAIGFGTITFLHVVFGELAPKTIAIARAERVALLVAVPMKFCYYLFLPGIVVFNGTANFFTRLIGVPPASETDEVLSEREILSVLAHAGTEGHVDAEEVEMIERVFELDDASIREVMVPRPDVVAVPADLPLSGLRETVMTAEHTRYPVVDPDDDDQVVGFVDVKDVLRALDEDAEATAGDLAREMPVVPETARVGDLLAQFQREQRQMAAVIDEWGALEGIATVEDVVEAVVGDIRDDFDADGEPSIDRREDGSYAIDGGVALSTVNEELEAGFEDEEVGTVGGLVLSRLGRAPEVGDRVAIEGYELRVEAVDGARIERVVVRETDGEPADGADAGEAGDPVAGRDADGE
ncbi:hemolysin family protein [Saliphagus infecundisoli]|uniref:Hemolysin family protein n=1 Tax=Saliphagus infecundisoli TaxID=1849069 RepID=A0ABD5QE05_9EURY|nr:hemolysin family protein [Saliphagus infecundisoli]